MLCWWRLHGHLFFGHFSAHQVGNWKSDLNILCFVSSENYDRFLAKAQWGIEYPFPQFFICCGFFLVYLLEELTLKVFATSEDSGSGHGHSHGGNGKLVGCCLLMKF